MTITKEKFDELLEVSKPLIKWLNENCHMNVQAQVSVVGVELFEGVASNRTTEFMKD